MAELIPLVALGGMYIIANHDKTENKRENKREQFSNMELTQNTMHGMMPHVNYPVTNSENTTNTHNYQNPNQITDKYFDHNVVKAIEKNNPPNSVGGAKKQTFGLTGEPIDVDKFKHNNMVPFFGARIKGATADLNTSEGTLDNMQGAGSQHRRKTEQAPLFKPQANMSWANGMPNMSEFYLSRQTPGTRMANVKPWDEERVAPGLGVGYNTKDSGVGYNAAVEDRNAWLPKTVNQLRVDTNPKITYELEGHQGPANAYIKDYGHIETQGRVEKNRPDTDYEVGPSRWFTTTGMEKAQTARGIEILQHVNRPETTAEYYGSSGQDGKATYIAGEFRDTKRQQLETPDVLAPSSSAAPSTGDYGHGSYKKNCNNRATVKQPGIIGGVESLIKAAISPIIDILRPTRKENVIGNLRPNGNAGSTVSALPIYNPADRTRTTIKEQTEGKIGYNHLNMQTQSENAYLVSKQTPVVQERDTTNISYGGTAAPATSVATSSYVAAYNQRNNPNKTQLSRPNHGSTNTLNNSMNISIARVDADRENLRTYAPAGRVNNAIPSVERYGDVNMRQSYNHNQGCERIDPSILKAFKENPYTQSLHSW
jgi:hypothetical protein